MRAGLVGALCAALLWPAGTASAASADPAAPSPILACIKDAAQSNSDAHACIGRAADACTEKPDGQSTVGESKCALDESAEWDRLLNKDYKQLLGLLKPEAADDVRKAQRLWVASRDADCRVPYYFYEGGSIVQILGARCQLDRTAERTLLIRSWLEMAKGEDTAQE